MILGEVSFASGKGKTSLGQSLLLISHFVIGVHKSKIIAICDVSKGSLFSLAGLISKHLEYLLKSGLRDTILLNTKSSLVILELAK